MGLRNKGIKKLPFDLLSFRLLNFPRVQQIIRAPLAPLASFSGGAHIGMSPGGAHTGVSPGGAHIGLSPADTGESPVGSLPQGGVLTTGP